MMIPGTVLIRSSAAIPWKYGTMIPIGGKSREKMTPMKMALSNGNRNRLNA